MEVVNFCYKRLHLRFCGSPRYASDVTIWVIHYVSNLFSFSFSLHGAHKKRKLFQTFLFLIKKTSTPLVNPIGTCSILFFLLFVAATNPKASVVIFATNLATFALASVDDSSFFPSESDFFFCSYSWSCHCNCTWWWIRFTFRLNNRMIFMGFPNLPSWLNSYAYFAPGLNFNFFCLKLN